MRFAQIATGVLLGVSILGLAGCSEELGSVSDMCSESSGEIIANHGTICADCFPELQSRVESRPVQLDPNGTLFMVHPVSGLNAQLQLRPCSQ